MGGLSVRLGTLSVEAVDGETSVSVSGTSLSSLSVGVEAAKMEGAGVGGRSGIQKVGWDVIVFGVARGEFGWCGGVT